MAELGRFNTLKILAINDSGAVLDGGNDGEIILPSNEAPDQCKVADDIDVFIYQDAKQNLVATTKEVAAQVGEVAHLEVIEINNVGAFMEWGPAKDLLIPYNQQRTQLMLGKSYLVYIYIDERTTRIAGSTKLNKFISQNSAYYKRGQQVGLVIWEKTDLGYSTVINNKHWGLLYYDDAPKPLQNGQSLEGYIKNVRDDGKIDLSLVPVGYQNIDPLAEKIYKRLEENNGFLALSDKSPPTLITKEFGVSKKAFKMSIGSLYKKRLITISKEGLTLIKEG